MAISDEKIIYFFDVFECEIYNGTSPKKAIEIAAESYASTFKRDIRPPEPAHPAPTVIPDPWTMGRRNNPRR